jgi:hypothetical protein
MQYLGARGKICLLGVRIVCMSATPCLSVHRCDMALFKYNLVGWSGKRQKTSSSPHVNANLFLPWSSWGFGLWCLNATFSHIVLYRGTKPEYSEKATDLPHVTDKLYHIMLYRVHLAWTLVVICTHCIGSYKSKYHTITTMTLPWSSWRRKQKILIIKNG